MAPRLFPHEDKVAHGVLLLMLALLVRWALPEAWGRSRGQIAALAALACYAVAMEALQLLVTASQRTFEWLDMACNLAGLCAGWVLFVPAVAGSREHPAQGAGRTAETEITTRGRAMR